MKNAAYFQQTKMVNPRFKHKSIRPKQKNLFYLTNMNCNFNTLCKKSQLRFISEIKRLFGEDVYMMEYWSKKLQISL